MLEPFTRCDDNGAMVLEMPAETIAAASRGGAPGAAVVATAEEVAAMEALGRRLDASGYAVLHSIAAGGQALVADARAAVAVTGAEAEWSLYRLLGLGLRIGAAELEPPDRALVEALGTAGLVVVDDGLVATTGWIVVPALGGYLVTGLPPTHGGAAGASAYLGNDSLRLAALLPSTHQRRVLDLGAGCGIQGLLACRGAAQAVLTDVDDFALRASALNAVLNAVSHPVRIVGGSLYEPVAGERFDLVATLCPYVPDAPGSGVTSVAAGGADGLALLGPVLAGAIDVLAEGGELVALAQLLCDDDGPLLADRLIEWCPRLAVELWCSDRHPLRPWVVEVAGRLASHGAPLSAGELVTAYSESLRGLGATGVCTTVIRARAGATGGVRVLGPAGAVLPRSVLRHAGRLVAGPAAGQAVALEGGAATNVDEVALALLRALDGERDVAEAAAAGWGRPPDADWRDVEELAAWRGAELVRAGLVLAEPGDDEVVVAPFAPTQLEALELAQAEDEPAYVCASGDGAALVPEVDGWRCPVCGARRAWAYALDTLAE
jgi:SAM-dependent methyltransferase